MYKCLIQGQNGIMNIYMWFRKLQPKDGTMESRVPIHELTHGLSSRLTGGRLNYLCLKDNQSMALSEGWSDFMAILLGRTAADTRQSDVSIGWFVSNSSPKSRGIRRFIYSTDFRRNPLRYSSYMENTERHAAGEIWASILNEVYFELVDNFGFSDDIGKLTKFGNSVMLQLLIGGMIIQPCNPTFMNARDAILRADDLYFASKHRCHIWTGFARRGLGVKASRFFRDSFEVPVSCRTTDV
jgi:extracellular elastinolytic metalloproteinase